MRSRQLVTIMVGVAFGLVWLVPDSAEAGKKKGKQEPIRYEIAPSPMPAAPDGAVIVEAGPCCDHKCCAKRDRRCKHECAPPPCPPTIEVRGCPPPCAVEKIFTVTYAKNCCTVEVPVLVPAGACEKIDRERDGDLELDYGKCEIEIKWKDGGRRLVIQYED